MVQSQRIAYERSLFIEGNLQDPITKSNVSSRLITIYMEQASRLIKAFSREGEIKIPVYDYWGPGIFQILNLDPYNPSVFEFIPKSDKRLVSQYYNTDLPVRTPVVINYLQQFIKRRKVVEVFDLLKTQKIEDPLILTKVPDATYKTEDFKSISSLKEFIDEAIINVKVRTINGIETVRLFNREEGDLFIDHPWYIVDGFLTFNEREVLKIPYQDILELRLYSKTSTVKENFEHFMWRGGVIEIITREVKYARRLRNNPNVAEIEGFSIKQNFNNTISLQESRTTPDLRGAIYWSSNVNTNEQGEGRLTVPLSDDTGKFTVVVMGTVNFRQPISGNYTFEVKTK